jgi:hypothetical protein
MALAEHLKPHSLPTGLRIVGADDPHVCRDCLGALVVVDDDGSISGTVGGLIDCVCVELAVPPGFVECRACASLTRVPDPRLGEYLDFCAASGMEPAWCLRCGEYRPLANGARAAGRCMVSRRQLPDGEYLGSFIVTGPWGHER